ncbi:DUF802 domain-containing protein [Pararobbsia silviterrae]|uniref:DUF802 domain-containing protein n=1 Tax=Pararobbsia silviterrae TaxID=1792498 RepID=A0A494XIR1_9BURK|nr:DUF802 domain-containing protein [Pararobbsia silviterrae]RKP49611.1 DUF802 domain-containing protein [Pararobbsia silviterrae]
MSRYRIHLVVFIAGLAALLWVAVGYATSNPLASVVTAVIAACYLAGAVELKRYDDATHALERAVDGLSDTPPDFGQWLAQLPVSLRGAVRLRVEGERAVLPGPALTPYLVGLLVLLGMLGTLLGMVATLRGTGIALDSATDLQAIRASLAAPVNGLGFAFGTSIAGVASSAMLGLLSALCRRERTVAAQQLDAKIVTTLRVHTLAHRREQSFELMRRQAEWMPALADRLQSTIEAIERRGAALDERQLANQHALHEKIETAYVRLASSVEHALKQSLAENARVVGAGLQPVVEATMAGLARETAAMRETVTRAVQTQLDGFSTGFDTATSTVAQTWQSALAEHQASSQALATQMQASLDGLGQQLETRTAGLLDGVSARLEATADSLSRTWGETLSQQAQANDALATRNELALAMAATAFEQRAQALEGGVRESHAKWHADLASNEAQRLSAWRETLDASVERLSAQWDQLGVRAETRQHAICAALEQTAQAITTQTRTHARETIAEIGRLVQTASEAPRAAADIIAEMREKLSESMVRDTAMLDERARLLHTVETLLDAVNVASTEQRAAVDTLVSTSADLLDRVGNAFTEKIDGAGAAFADKVDRVGAMFSDKVDHVGVTFADKIDHVGAAFADKVDHVGAAFAEHTEHARTAFSETVDHVEHALSGTLESESAKLDRAAADVTGSAVEVASLGDAFGSAVQQFGASNDKLVAQLERIEGALEKSIARSDEQLAYYVAQAREVIELCMMSQKQIIEEMQALAGARAPAGAPAA